MEIEYDPENDEFYIVIPEKILNSRDGDFCYRWFNGETLQSIALSANPKLTPTPTKGSAQQVPGLYTSHDYFHTHLYSTIL